MVLRQRTGGQLHEVTQKHIISRGINTRIEVNDKQTVFTLSDKNGGRSIFPESFAVPEQLDFLKGAHKILICKNEIVTYNTIWFLVGPVPRTYFVWDHEGVIWLKLVLTNLFRGISKRRETVSFTRLTNRNMCDILYFLSLLPKDTKI